LRWSSAASDLPDLERAVETIAARIEKEMDGKEIDLLLVFPSSHFVSRYHEIPELLGKRIPHGALVGCAAGGVIGGGEEIENRPGISATAAHLPDVRVNAVALEAPGLPDLDAPPGAWRDLFSVAAEERPHFVIVADPFSFPTEILLSGLDYAYPKSAKIGGLASAARQRGANALYAGERVLTEGAVVIALSGNVEMETAVAQGCRPIGEPMRITRCKGNWLLQLDGHPPIEVIQKLIASLPDEDRDLATHSLFLGIVMDELTSGHRPGDYLIRNLIGMEPNSGALAVGDRLREGRTVRFHLRDRRSSAEDLESVLRAFAERKRPHPPEGALLFSCLGRGEHLYGGPNHDSDLFRSRLGEIPLGGFFCNGEIGPVGGSTYLHGYTSAFGVFRPARGDSPADREPTKATRGERL